MPMKVVLESDDMRLKSLWFSLKVITSNSFMILLARLNPRSIWLHKRIAAGWGYWTVYRYQDDRALGHWVLGVMTKKQALEIVCALPNSKIRYVDDEKGFIFVE